MKKITIDGKEYEIECNGLTYILHKRLFNISIMQDIAILRNYLITQTLKSNQIKNKFPKVTEKELSIQLSKFMKRYVNDFIEAITRITYTLMYTANDRIKSYDDFFKSIKKIKIDDNWIIVVIAFTVDCFVDDEVSQELEKMEGSSEKQLFPEHLFLLACLRLGLTIQDLKFLTYIDVIKIFLSIEKKNNENKKNIVRKATQADIDRLLM